MRSAPFAMLYDNLKDHINLAKAPYCVWGFVGDLDIEGK
jgi:hypothetical protein